MRSEPAVSSPSEFDWNNVWQVACGDSSRDFRDLFFDFGLIAVGAVDDKGPYHEVHRPYDTSEYGDATQKLWPVAAGMAEGHTVILKKGKSIVGIGQIASPYQYDGRREPENWQCENFEELSGDVLENSRLDDVDGWDLRHNRRVNWWTSDDELSAPSLTRGTVSRVNSESVIEKAKEYVESARALAPKKQLRDPPSRILSNSDILLWLMDRGLSSSQSEELAQRLLSLQRLAQWYERRSSDVSEHEIRAYLVWPLLQVLGWSEQCIKFEYRNMDLAVFSAPVIADNQSPEIVIETKRLFSGLNQALQQAEGYWTFDDSAKRIVATDGVRYLLEYTDSEGSTSRAYMNLLRLRDEHPFDASMAGAKTVFAQLLRY